jgi:hypothetical protein
MLKLISHAEAAPPNKKIFQNGTANTDTAVKFQRGGPKFSSPDADSGWDHAFVSRVNTWTSSNCLRGASGSRRGPSVNPRRHRRRRRDTCL